MMTIRITRQGMTSGAPAARRAAAVFVLAAALAAPAVPAVAGPAAPAPTAAAANPAPRAVADTYEAAVLAAKPAFFWRFADADGATTVADSGPAGVVGRVNGPAAFVRTDGAAGTTSSVLLSNGPRQPHQDPDTVKPGWITAAKRTTAGAVTAVAWFRSPNKYPGNLLSVTPTADAKADGAWRSISIDHNGLIGLVASDGTLLQGTTDYADGKWHMIAYVETATQVTASIDGLQFATATFGDHLNNGWVTVGNPHLPFADLRLDEAASFGRALSQSELSGLYTAGGGTVERLTAPTVATVQTVPLGGLLYEWTVTPKVDPRTAAAFVTVGFGDGTSTTRKVTGAIARISHAYTKVGSYPTTVTVTDATGAVSAPVKQTMAADDVVVLDRFTGDDDILSTCLPTGPGCRYGGPLVVSKGMTDSGQFGFDVPGTSHSMYWTGANVRDVDARVAYQFDTKETGAGTYLNLLARRSATADYRVKLVHQPNGKTAVAIQRVVGAKTTYLATKVVDPGVAGNLRFRVVSPTAKSTQLQVKVWRKGAAEPTAWTATSTDTYAPLVTAGQIGMIGYLSSTAARQPTGVLVDDLEVRRVGGAAAPSHSDLLYDADHGRISASGWGTAEVGPKWTQVPAAAPGENGVAGLLTVPAGARRSMVATGFAPKDIDAVFRVKAPQNNDLTCNGKVTLEARGTAAQGSGYRISVQYGPGKPVVSLAREKGGKTTVLASKAVNVNPCTEVWVHARVVGKANGSVNLRASAWGRNHASPDPRTGLEPTGFMLAATDAKGVAATTSGLAISAERPAGSTGQANFDLFPIRVMTP